MLEKDRIDRALDRHRKHQIEEARNSDCDFHREVLFPSREMPCRLKEGERVTAEITLSIVRNGVRQGDVFVSDQGEEFSLNQVGEWLANNGK